MGLLSSFLIFTACLAQAPSDTIQLPVLPGVAYELAVQRRAVLNDIRYNLSFDIPADRDSAVGGMEELVFTLSGDRQPLLIDFKPGDGVASISGLRVNGKTVPLQYEQEHIILPAGSLVIGANTVTLSFRPGNAALNRNKDFLYTLLVPDRARTIFPCFDQPDLKAVFDLSLTMPVAWRALGNGVLRDSAVNGTTKTLHFLPSDRISTYLFSFAAGRFTETSRTEDGRRLNFFYRETDSSKLRLSIDSVFTIERQALRFMADYTGIAYPFQKFDFVAIPDFQFGGMEHVGAIQYKASSLFLDIGATREQRIGRSNLLSHETAHMWFGDLVTMSWFNDVWMKEVFANFMADKISNVTLSDGNYDLKFLTDHFPAAYSIDRTAGAHPIRQTLDNLQDAGSLYGNIIYHKAPIMMRQLERLMGELPFRDGLRDYLKQYAGSNASWPDLIRNLQAHTSLDLATWNQVWVNGAGRPKFSYTLQGSGGTIRSMTIHQQGEDGSARVWPQLFDLAFIYKDRVETFPVNSNAATVTVPSAVGKARPRGILFNADGQGYGLFPTDAVLPVLASPLMRAAHYINLYENMLAGRKVTPRALLAYDRIAIAHEPEELCLNLLLDQLSSIFWRFIPPRTRDSLAAGIERDCWQAMRSATSANDKKALFRTFSTVMTTRKGQDTLYAIWKTQHPPDGVKLSEDDYTGLAAALALRNYPGYRGILDEQLARVTNQDRRDRLQYLLPALSNDTAERDRFFATLQDASARRKEAWVLTALSYLHHPLRVRYSEKYLAASLDWLADIQRTGDVFFPQSWLQASFTWYRTPTAASLVRRFLRDHPDYNPKLRAKILQATDNLFRATRLAAGYKIGF